MSDKPSEEEINWAFKEASDSYDHPHIFPQHKEVIILAAALRAAQAQIASLKQHRKTDLDHLEILCGEIAALKEKVKRSEARQDHYTLKYD